MFPKVKYLLETSQAKLMAVGNPFGKLCPVMLPCMADTCVHVLYMYKV
jgi:hypothetical protein